MKKYTFLIPLFYLGIGFINIHLALLGLICILLPVGTLFKTKSRSYCQNYCPRSGMLATTLEPIARHSLNIPKIIRSGNLRRFFFTYFIINMSFAIITTIVAVIQCNGIVAELCQVAKIEVRFFMIFPIGELPQLFTISAPVYLTHLSYRFYSMIFTTVILGFVMGILYKPKTWCAVCPITQMNNLVLNKKQ